MGEIIADAVAREVEKKVASELAEAAEWAVDGTADLAFEVADGVIDTAGEIVDGILSIFD